MPKTLEDFFARQEPRNFPLPKKLKPYTNIKATSWSNYMVKISLKATGSGKLELFVGGEKVNALYIQGTDWQELTREANELKAILTGRACA